MVCGCFKNSCAFGGMKSPVVTSAAASGGEDRLLGEQNKFRASRSRARRCKEPLHGMRRFGAHRRYRYWPNASIPALGVKQRVYRLDPQVATIGSINRLP